MSATLFNATIISSIAVVVAAIVGRWAYKKYVLKDRLYFEPWHNLSGEPSLEIGASFSEILVLALETGLTTYDASYLYLSRSLGADLVTFDEQLQRVS